MLIIDSFEDTWPLNTEPNMKKIDFKLYLYNYYSTGNVLINEQIRLRNKYLSEIDDLNRGMFRLRNAIIISAFLLLRMLSYCLTEDVFHAGLIRYLDKQ